MLSSDDLIPFIDRYPGVTLVLQVRAGLIRMCGVVHTSIKVLADRFYEELLRRVYTTPKSYLDLINSYTSKLGQLQGAVETKAAQMEVEHAVVQNTIQLRGTRLLGILRCQVQPDHVSFVSVE